MASWKEIIDSLKNNGQGSAVVTNQGLYDNYVNIANQFNQGSLSNPSMLTMPSTTQYNAMSNYIAQAAPNVVKKPTFDYSFIESIPLTETQQKIKEGADKFVAEHQPTETQQQWKDAADQVMSSHGATINTDKKPIITPSESTTPSTPTTSDPVVSEAERILQEKLDSANKEIEGYKNQITGLTGQITGLTGQVNNLTGKNKELNEGNLEKQKALDEWNSKGFNYDAYADPIYQNYLASMQREGQRAMKDTMGQAAALTGGYGSTYATQVGNAAYNDYLQKANNMIPSLYQDRLSSFNSTNSASKGTVSAKYSEEALNYVKSGDSAGLNEYLGRLDAQGENVDLILGYIEENSPKFEKVGSNKYKYGNETYSRSDLKKMYGLSDEQIDALKKAEEGKVFNAFDWMN